MAVDDQLRSIAVITAARPRRGHPLQAWPNLPGEVPRGLRLCHLPDEEGGTRAEFLIPRRDGFLGRREDSQQRRR